MPSIEGHFHHSRKIQKKWLLLVSFSRRWPVWKKFEKLLTFWSNPNTRPFIKIFPLLKYSCMVPGYACFYRIFQYFKIRNCRTVWIVEQCFVGLRRAPDFRRMDDYLFHYLIGGMMVWSCEVGHWLFCLFFLFPKVIICKVWRINPWRAKKKGKEKANYPMRFMISVQHGWNLENFCSGECTKWHCTGDHELHSSVRFRVLCQIQYYTKKKKEAFSSKLSPKYLQTSSHLCKDSWSREIRWVDN